MNEIVVNHDGIKVTYENDQMLVSSLEVAKIFGKNHRDVMRDIRNLKEGAQNCADLFYESTYVHEQNKQQYPMYLMNRDGFTLLAMGFTGMDKKHPSIEFIINTDGIDDALKHLNVMIEKLKEANSLADELTSKLVQEKEIALDGKLITFPLGNRD